MRPVEDALHEQPRKHSGGVCLTRFRHLSAARFRDKYAAASQHLFRLRKIHKNGFAQLRSKQIVVEFIFVALNAIEFLSGRRSTIRRRCLINSAAISALLDSLSMKRRSLHISSGELSVLSCYRMRLRMRN